MNMLFDSTKTRNWLYDTWYQIKNTLYDNPRTAVYRTYHLLKHGWRPADAWDMSYWFCTYAPKILRSLAKNRHGCPMTGCVNKGRMLFPEIFPNIVDMPDNTDLDDNFNYTDDTDWTVIINALADLIQNSDVNTCTYKNEINVIGETWLHTKIKSLDIETGRPATYYRIDRVDNATFDAWCARETEIEQLTACNAKRALHIFAELLPQLCD